MIYTMRRVMLMLLVLIATSLSAQNISVSSFKLLENDLTANTYGTSEKDFNGEIAALIKVVTTEQGLVFDGGMVGIVKTKQGVGEVWVYVPHGIKRITVQHHQLGVLRDYYFPIPIEKARTYEMVLTTGRVETVVTHAVNKQYVFFNVTPANASVELGDEVLTVDETGLAAKNVPFGIYDYRVSCANYHTEAGRVTVTAEGRAEVNVTLRPNFGWIKLDAAAEEYRGAYVYINNERVGQLPYMSGELKSGTYRVKVAKSMYKSSEAQVKVADNETTTMNISLVPNFATVTLLADAESEIWIDGEKKSTGRWSGPLEIGDYTVEVRKPSHRSASDVIHVLDVAERTIQLKSPTPIYAPLELESNPLRATVLIDGVEVGETPMMKTDVLVGTYRVVFKKEGYKSVEKTIVVKENEENRLSAMLTNNNRGNGASNTGGKGSVAPAVNTKTKESSKETPKVQKKEAPKDGAERSFYALGATIGYSPYGLSYGGNVSYIANRLSINVGATNYVMGKYTMCDNKTGDNEEDYSVQLLRFAATLGYTWGEQFLVTPQVGMVFGPSFITGRKYVMNELPVWDGITSTDRVLADRDYSAMNSRIMKFVDHSRFNLLLGVRLGYVMPSGIEMHITPQYVIGEGISVNTGISIKF